MAGGLMNPGNLPDRLNHAAALGIHRPDGVQDAHALVGGGQAGCIAPATCGTPTEARIESRLSTASCFPTAARTSSTLIERMHFLACSTHTSSPQPKQGVRW